MSMTMKKSLGALLLLMALFILMPQEAYAGKQNVNVGNLVITTTDAEGLLSPAESTRPNPDYRISKRGGCSEIELYTAKPVTVKMKPGAKKANAVLYIYKPDNGKAANITFDNVHLETTKKSNIPLHIGSYGDYFTVNLSLKGKNSLKSTKADRSIETLDCVMNIKGGSLTCNKSIDAIGSLTIRDCNLTMLNKKDINVDNGEKSKNSGKLSLYDAEVQAGGLSGKNVFLDHAKVTLDVKGACMRGRQNVSITDGSVVRIASRGDTGALGGKSLKVSDSKVTIEIDTDYVNSAVEFDTAEIQRSTFNVGVNASDVADTALKVYKELSIKDSSVTLKGCMDGIYSSKGPVYVTNSKVNINAKERAFIVGPVSGETLPLNKINLKNCKLKNGAYKSRWEVYEYGRYGSAIVIRNSSGGFAKTVNIANGGPTQPVVSTAVVENSGKPKLSWKKSVFNDKYIVYRATSKNGKYKKLTTTTKVTYTDTSAKAETTYYYKVRGVTGGKKSKYSAIKMVTCDLAKPTITLSVVADSGKIKVSWKKIANADKYQVWSATSKNGKYERIGTTSELSLIHKGGKGGKTYYYKVKAVSTKNSNANSAFSVVKSKKSKVIKPVVSNSRDEKTGKPVLSWKSIKGADQYQIWHSTKKHSGYEKIATVKTLSYIHTKATADKLHYYKVKPVSNKSTNNFDYSTIQHILCGLAAPQVTGEFDGNKVTLTWKAVTGTKYYEVEYIGSDDEGRTYHDNTKKTTHSEYVDAGVTYSYRVRACGTNTSSQWSKDFVITIPAEEDITL